MLRAPSRILLLAVSLCAAGAPAALAAQGDEAAIRRVHADFSAAWNRHDPAAMAAGWSNDGDLVNPQGRSAKGRAEVQKLFAEEQAGPFKGTTFTHTVTGVRFLVPTVAVVDASYEIANAPSPSGTGTTTFKGLYKTVMVKKAGKWWTVSVMAMAPLGPPGASPTPAAHH